MQKLYDHAKAMTKKAYAPYSNFHVGAALLTKDGTIIGGCNVENSSYGLCICAERTALVSAISQGYTEFIAMAVVTKSSATPCGPCRQFIHELCGDIPIYIGNFTSITAEHTAVELLPHAFSAKNL